MTDPLGLIRSAGAQPAIPQAPAGPGSGAAGVSFKDELMKNIEKVNQLQQDAQAAADDLACGKGTQSSVYLAKAKADLAFQLLMQVRNKMVDAYNEVNQMRV